MLAPSAENKKGRHANVSRAGLLCRRISARRRQAYGALQECRNVIAKTDGGCPALLVLLTPRLVVARLSLARLLRVRFARGCPRAFRPLWPLVTL
jgi:hypothetical protein